MDTTRHQSSLWGHDVKRGGPLADGMLLSGWSRVNDHTLNDIISCYVDPDLQETLYR